MDSERFSMKTVPGIPAAPPPPVEPHDYRIYYVNIDFPCRWVANVPPRETSPEAKSEEKRPISQATKEEDQQQT